MSDKQAALIREVVTAVMTVGALIAVGYLAVTARNETAIGALIGILSAATGYLMRGRVETPKS